MHLRSIRDRVGPQRRFNECAGIEHHEAEPLIEPLMEKAHDIAVGQGLPTA